MQFVLILRIHTAPHRGGAASQVMRNRLSGFLLENFPLTVEK